MKKFLLLSLIPFLPLVKAQETLPVYQQYLLNGKFLINPAFYGNTDDIVLNGNYQKQFSKFAESPNVQSVGLHANIVDRVGAGAVFFKDESGPISANGITLGASYFIPLSDDQNREDQFSFGAATSLYNWHVDVAKLNPTDPNDPLLYSGEDSNFLAYANLGMQFTYRNFFGSFSALDIPLSKTAPIVNGIEPAPTKFLVNFGYDWQLDDQFSIEPSTLINFNTNSAKLIDLNLLAKISGEENNFAAGISYRSFTDHNGSQTNSFSPILKADISRLTFGAAYNFGLSQISSYGGNSFMLSLGYRFENFINARGFRYR